ncbi:MAG TPA: helix-turn-helix transcriptional regulator [Solirubrobacterales bacterium]|jgi:transcriptional regulator with XRE-family HTH domain|nr:helix-turn-helix transcriptional regulator [Solirubrobacterales bacterium]
MSSGRGKARAAGLVERIVDGSGLSQAELARRAGIPRSVLNVYLRGRREPGADALVRLAGAAGFDLQLTRREPPVDPQRAGEILVQVLELAEALPFRPRAELQFPPLIERLAAAA